METVKIKNSNIMKLLEAAASSTTSAEEEKESEQHVTVKIRKKGTCGISTNMNKKRFRNSWMTISNILCNCFTYSNKTVNYFAYL